MRAAFLLLSLLPFAALAQAPTSSMQSTLAGLRDRARPLLIFAAKPDDPQLEIQLRTLNEHAAEMTDRELVPIALPYRNPSSTSVTFSADEAEKVRQRFRVAPNEFTVILIGKDGGEKLRSHKPLTMRQLNETIDAMPMRQEEMRGKP